MKRIVRLNESDIRRMVNNAVRHIIRENFNEYVNIAWKYDNTEVYVNDMYAGYIDNIGENGWYGKCSYMDGDRPTMKSFGVSYDKDDICNEIEEFITNNKDSVIHACKIIRQRKADFLK